MAVDFIPRDCLATYSELLILLPIPTDFLVQFQNLRSSLVEPLMPHEGRAQSAPICRRRLGRAGVDEDHAIDRAGCPTGFPEKVLGSRHSGEIEYIFEVLRARSLRVSFRPAVQPA